MSYDSTPPPPMPPPLPVSAPAAPPRPAQLSCLGNLVHSPVLPALEYCWIVFSNQVNSKRAVGGAQVASRKAKSFAIWAAVIELIVDVVYGVTTVLLASKE